MMTTYEEARKAFEEGFVGGGSHVEKVSQIKRSFSDCVSLLKKLYEEGKVIEITNLPTKEEIEKCKYLIELIEISNHLREKYFPDEEILNKTPHEKRRKFAFLKFPDV